jgi:hypothetical protein
MESMSERSSTSRGPITLRQAALIAGVSILIMAFMAWLLIRGGRIREPLETVAQNGASGRFLSSDE